MQKIIKRKKKGVTVQYMVEDDPTPGTLGNLLLLKEQYRVGPNYEQMIFNASFLKKMLDKYGELHCVYCGKKGLRIYHWKDFHKNRRIMATADHFIPKSVVPHLARDESNLRVSCENCNTQKAQHYWDEKFPYPEIINNELQTQKD